MEQDTREAFGQHLQRLRLEREISLSQLAADAGIAKSNLSRLEQGQGNPTLDTIWRLATRLNVPFGALIEPMHTAIAQGGVQVRLVDQGKDDPHVDVYWMSCAPRTVREAEPHSPGTVETVTIISGELEVAAEGKTRRLRAGESHTFPGDTPHTYRTREAWATLSVTVIYKKRGKAKK